MQLPAIHAGRDRSRDAEALLFLRGQGLEPPTGEELEGLRGRVLGICDLVDCIGAKETRGFPFITEIGRYTVGSDPYAFGPWCWVLEGVEPLAEPVGAVGRLGLWDWSRGPVC